MRIACLVIAMVGSLAIVTVGGAADAARPNIIWIVADDMSPDLGCYGVANARTPNLDRFAAQGARFTNCFTHAPVCAPCRSGLITGMYPTAIGSLHMRSTLHKPPKLFTEHLQEAGYFVAWPGKTDFNFAVPKRAFSSTENWLKDAPPKQPFFAYTNIQVTHEGQVRAPAARHKQNTARLTAEQRQDPAKMTLPPYYPDAPEVRENIAHYHELVTAFDYQVGDVLKWIDDNKLTDNTVVMIFADHGWGMSRGKRWVYDSGIRVPLLVRWPGQIKPGSVRDDLVAFLDFSATVVNLAGVKQPENLHGQVFLGPDAKERKYVYAARDRMDETPDRIRAVRDKQFKYIRNYRPELPYAQYINYMDEMPTMQVWRKWHHADKLTGPQKLFFAPRKPDEELYDTAADPHEIKNLAGDEKYAEKLAELRAAHEAWVKQYGDLGAVSEQELINRGLVADRLNTEYAERAKLHPKEPPVRTP